MQDDRVRLDGRGITPFLPSGAQEGERGVTRVDVHRHSAATRRADDDIGTMLLILGLGDADSFVEVVVGKSGINDFVAVRFQEGRLPAARNAGPAVEEEDSHDRRALFRSPPIC